MGTTASSMPPNSRPNAPPSTHPPPPQAPPPAPQRQCPRLANLPGKNMTRTEPTTRSSAPEHAAPAECVILDSVSKIYGSFAALRNVSATFTAGSCTVILGENGAGKSTLLRIVAGLINPTRGSITVYSESPHKQRHRVAYMSHSAMLYDELTAMENLTYFASLHHTGHGCACVGSPEMALRAVGLDPNLKRPLGQYSQGM